MIRRRLRDDRGSASVVAVGLLAAVVTMGVAAIGAASVLAERSRVSGAADAAALAAADAVAGLTSGPPCAAAASVGSANGVGLSACVVEGLTVTVRVSASVGVVAVSASATAGPPSDPAPPARGGL